MTLLEAKTGQPWKGFWSAVLWVDGVETSFSCNHNHKTEGAARKCLDNVIVSARRFVWHPSFQQTVVDTVSWGDGDSRILVEWSRETNPNGGRVTTRFRLGSAAAAPEGEL